MTNKYATGLIGNEVTMMVSFPMKPFSSWKTQKYEVWSELSYLQANLWIFLHNLISFVAINEWHLFKHPREYEKRQGNLSSINDMYLEPVI